MAIVRNSVFAGVIVSLAAIAACQSTGPSGPSVAPGGIEGEWMSADGVAVSRFSGGTFVTTATDTGNKLAEGSYVMTAPNAVQITATSLIRQAPVSFNCLLVSSKQLNCTSASGAPSTLVRRA